MPFFGKKEKKTEKKLPTKAIECDKQAFPIDEGHRSIIITVTNKGSTLHNIAIIDTIPDGWELQEETHPSSKTTVAKGVMHKWVLKTVEKTSKIEIRYTITGNGIFKIAKSDLEIVYGE